MNTSLLARIEATDGNYFSYVSDCTFSLSEEREQALGKAYHSLENVSGLYNENTFDIYQEAESLDAALFEEYTTLVNQFRSPKCKLVRSNWLKRKTHKCQVRMDKDNKYHHKIGSRFAIGGIVTGAVTGGVLFGFPGVFIGAVGGMFGSLLGGGAYYDIYGEKIKPETYRFKGQTAKELLITTHRLHYVAHKLYNSVKDVNGIDVETADYLITKCGVKDILQQIKAAKTEVQQVIKYTGTLLDALEITLPVPTGMEITEPVNKPEDEEIAEPKGKADITNEVLTND